MERCEACLERIDGGLKCACRRNAERQYVESQVEEWLAMVDDENARLAEAGKKGKFKGEFDAMKAIARSGRLNIPDLEERATYRRDKAAEIIGDPLKKAKWRRPRQLPPRSVYTEVI